MEQTLRLAIDSRRAVSGARQFEAATDRVTRSAFGTSRGFFSMSTGIGRVGLALRGAVPLLGVLSAAGATAGIVALGRSAIQTAGAFEQLEVRLRVLTGSGQTAADTIERLRDLSTETPFSVQGLTDAAASMAVVFKNSGEEIQEFTKIVANIAAATGLTVEQAGQNVQRALSAGLGAADLLRDKGIAAQLLEISGAADVTKLKGKELQDAFRALAGETGPLGNAAAELALTLTGSLSNIGVAAENFRAEFGKALSPAVIALANEAFIPFFQSLERLVVENRQEIIDFTRVAIAGLIRGFADTIRGGAEVLDFFDKLNINATTTALSLTAAYQATSAGINILLEPLRGIRDFLGDTAESAALLALNLGFIDKPAFDAIQGINSGFSDFDDTIADTEKRLRALKATLSQLTTEIETNDPFSDETANRLREWAAALEQVGINVDRAIVTAAEQQNTIKEAANAGSEATKRHILDQKELDRATQRAGQAISNTFEAMIFDARTADDAMKILLADLARIAVRAAVLDPLAGFIGQGIKSGINFGASSILGGGATGTDFLVGGVGGSDSQLVAFKASPGERVTVQTPGQQAADRRPGGGGINVQVFTEPGLSARVDTFTQDGVENARIFVERTAAESAKRGDGPLRRALRGRSVGEVV